MGRNGSEAWTDIAQAGCYRKRNFEGGHFLAIGHPLPLCAGKTSNASNILLTKPAGSYITSPVPAEFWRFFRTGDPKTPH